MRRPNKKLKKETEEGTPPKGASTPPPHIPSPTTPLTKQQQLKLKNSQQPPSSPQPSSHTSPSQQAASPIRSPSSNGISEDHNNTHPHSSTTVTSNGVIHPPTLEDTHSAPTSSSSTFPSLSSPLESESLISLLRKQRKRPGPDTRFENGLYAIEKVEGLKPSLSINLYPSGFTLANQSSVSINLRTNGPANQSQEHAYDRNTRELLLAIDQNRLLPDLIELLDETNQTNYYDGCVIVELRDHRHSASSFPMLKHSSSSLATSSASLSAPHVRWALLEPSMESVVYDIEGLGKAHSWGPDELIAFEQKLLSSTCPPLCLSPSPHVFETEHARVYNLAKFNRKGPRFYAAARAQAQAQTQAALSALGGAARQKEKEKEKERDKERFMCVPESHHEPFAKVLVVPTVAPAAFALAKYLQARNVPIAPTVHIPVTHYPYVYMYPKNIKSKTSPPTTPATPTTTTTSSPSANPPTPSTHPSIPSSTLPSTHPPTPSTSSTPSSLKLPVIPPPSKLLPQLDLVARRTLKFFSTSGFIAYTYEITALQPVGYQCEVRVSDTLVEGRADHNATPPYSLCCTRSSLAEALEFVGALKHLFERDGAYTLGQDSAYTTQQNHQLDLKIHQLRLSLEQHMQQQKIQQQRYHQYFNTLHGLHPQPQPGSQQPLAGGVAGAQPTQAQGTGMPPQTQQLLLAQAQAQAHGMQQIVNSGTYPIQVAGVHVNPMGTHMRMSGGVQPGNAQVAGPPPAGGAQGAHATHPSGLARSDFFPATVVSGQGAMTQPSQVVTVPGGVAPGQVGAQAQGAQPAQMAMQQLQMQQLQQLQLQQMQMQQNQLHPGPQQVHPQNQHPQNSSQAQPSQSQQASSQPPNPQLQQVMQQQALQALQQQGHIPQPNATSPYPQTAPGQTHAQQVQAHAQHALHMQQTAQQPMHSTAQGAQPLQQQTQSHLTHPSQQLPQHVQGQAHLTQPSHLPQSTYVPSQTQGQVYIQQTPQQPYNPAQGTPQTYTQATQGHLQQTTGQPYPQQTIPQQNKQGYSATVPQQAGQPAVFSQVHASQPQGQQIAQSSQPHPMQAQQIRTQGNPTQPLAQASQSQVTQPFLQNQPRPPNYNPAQPGVAQAQAKPPATQLSQNLPTAPPSRPTLPPGQAQAPPKSNQISAQAPSPQMATQNPAQNRPGVSTPPQTQPMTSQTQPPRPPGAPNTQTPIQNQIQPPKVNQTQMVQPQVVQTTNPPQVRIPQQQQPPQAQPLKQMPIQPPSTQLPANSQLPSSSRPTQNPTSPAIPAGTQKTSPAIAPNQGRPAAPQPPQTAPPSSLKPAPLQQQKPSPPSQTQASPPTKPPNPLSTSQSST